MLIPVIGIYAISKNLKGYVNGIFLQAFFVNNLEPMKFWEFVSLVLDGLGYQRYFTFMVCLIFIVFAESSILALVSVINHAYKRFRLQFWGIIDEWRTFLTNEYGTTKYKTLSRIDEIISAVTCRSRCYLTGLFGYINESPTAVIQIFCYILMMSSGHHSYVSLFVFMVIEKKCNCVGQETLINIRYNIKQAFFSALMLPTCWGFTLKEPVALVH